MNNKLTFKRMKMFWYLQKVVKHPPFPLLSENSGCLSCHLSKTSSSNLEQQHQSTFFQGYLDTNPLFLKDIHSTISQQHPLTYSGIFSRISLLLLFLLSKICCQPVFGHHLYWQFRCWVELQGNHP